MERSNVKFSNLTSDQLKEVQALESKINSTTQGHETILIAYATSEQP